MGSRTFFMQFLKGAFELSADDMYLCTCKCDYLEQLHDEKKLVLLRTMPISWTKYVPYWVRK